MINKQKNRDTINKMIQDNYKLIESVIKKYCHYQLIDDFWQELYLILYSLSDKDIEEKYKGQILLYFIVSVIKKQLYSTNSKFYKNYVKKINIQPVFQTKINDNVIVSNYQTDIETEYIIEEDKQLENKKINEYKQLIETIFSEEIGKNDYFYINKTLWKMKYEKGMTYRAISKKTNIPLSSVHLYVQHVNEKIKEKLEQKRKKDI